MSATLYRLVHARDSTHRDSNPFLVERQQGVEHELDEIFELARRDDVFPASGVKRVHVDAATSCISGCDSEVFVEEEDKCGKGRWRGGQAERRSPPSSIS